MRNVSALAGTWTDTSAYPHSGSNFDPLTANDIAGEVQRAIAVNGWPSGYHVQYFVYTASGVISCTGTGCAGTDFCGYHSAFGTFSNPVIYANIPYGGISGCQLPLGPNGNIAADTAINVSSHEQVEAATDPVFDGWYDSDGGFGEIADKCAYQFGAVAADGSNLLLNGHKYLIQQEWSNLAFTGAANSGCVQSFVGLPATLLSPVSNVTGTIRIPALSWTRRSSGATSYDIYFGPSTSPTFYRKTTNTSTTVGPLAPGTTYYWYVVAWSGSIASPPSPTRSFTTTVNLDTADIVFRNTQTGDVAGWLMNGLTLSQGAVIYPGLSSAWRIDAIGDLNGDGDADFVFRNTQTGDVSGWLMNGLTPVQGAIIYSGLPATWQIQGIGDLDADGKADLVFRNVQTGDVSGWLMNGLAVAQAGIIYSGLPVAWQIASTADLNGDGKIDLVFRNTQSGDVSGWLMDGVSLAGAAIIYSNLPAAWQIARAGDLNGDRNADLVFRNTQTGDVAGWLMNGLTVEQGAIIYAGLPAAWQIKSIGDLNGDGRADLLFGNAQTGDVSGWLMNGFSLAQGAIIYSRLPSLWQVQGTGDLNGK
jgi:hypothetical protein